MNAASLPNLSIDREVQFVVGSFVCARLLPPGTNVTRSSGAMGGEVIRPLIDDSRPSRSASVTLMCIMREIRGADQCAAGARVFKKALIIHDEWCVLWTALARRRGYTAEGKGRRCGRKRKGTWNEERRWWQRGSREENEAERGWISAGPLS